MLLKWKNKSGWEILYKNFFEKVIGICNNVLQKGNNLSDLPDKAAARANLGINDIFMTTDGGQLKGSLGFANNTWNPVGDDAYFGDKDKAGHFAIKSQKTNTPTGLALVAANSSNDSNYASIQYDGTNITINKPIKASEGFVAENVAAINLDNQNKIGFVYGECNSSSGAELTSIFGTGGQDYGGLIFGTPIPSSSSNVYAGELGQLIFMGGKLAFREKDGLSPDVPWTPWKQIAFIPDVEKAVSNVNLSDYAKVDAKNIDVALWSTTLAKGAINSTDTKAVSGKTVNAKLAEYNPTGTITSGNTKAVTGGTVYTALNGYAKADAKNLTTAQKDAWSAALASGTISSGNKKAVSGGTLYTELEKVKATLNTAINNAQAVATQNIKRNGYIKFSNGLMIQWGIYPTTATGNRESWINNAANLTADKTVSFPVTFTEDCYTVAVSLGGDLVANQFDMGYVQVTSWTKTGFTIGWHRDYFPLHWIAIGK